MWAHQGSNRTERKEMIQWIILVRGQKMNAALSCNANE
jgi:hypothetical protein